MTSSDIQPDKLVINQLTRAQYGELSSQNKIYSNQVYCITDFSETDTYINGIKTDISVKNVSGTEYETLVKNGQALSNVLYVVSSDTANMYGERVTNVGTPTADSDAATKVYVDGQDTVNRRALESQMSSFLTKTAQTLTDAEKQQVGVNTGFRYKLTSKTLQNCTYQGSSGLSCQVEDYAVNEISVSSADKPIFIFLPQALDDRARDFVIRLVVTASTSPTIAYVPYGDEDVDYDTNDDTWSSAEPGINLISFTETSR